MNSSLSLPPPSSFHPSAADNYLSHMPFHPIFNKSTSNLATNSTTVPTSLQSQIGDDDDDQECQRKAKMAVRKTELLVATGTEVRSCNLVESGTSNGTYRVFRNPALDFEIQQLVLNPTGRLLAVVGSHQLAVIALPSSSIPSTSSSSILTPNQCGTSSSSSVERVECKGTKIAADIHMSNGYGSRITKVSWHPWGANGTCLMVLTDDGMLREYDTTHSVTEAQQALSFLPRSILGRGLDKSSRRKSNVFGLAQDGSQTAVSFTLGHPSSSPTSSAADWGPLTLYGLMANGDMYAVCPYLPKHASLPSAYAESLDLFLQGKAQKFREEGANRNTLRVGASPGAGSNTNERAIMSRRLAEQNKFTRSILHQIQAQRSSSYPTLNMDSSTLNESAPNRLYQVSSPVELTTVAVQGPLLVQPEPADLDGSEDAGSDVNGVASDIAYLGAASPGQDSIGVLIVAWKDGRIDLCLEVEKVEAQWNPNMEEDAPILLVYESIDLGLLAVLPPPPSVKSNKFSATHSSSNPILAAYPPMIVMDQSDDRKFFVYHAAGVHSISISIWYDRLIEALKSEKPESGLQALWEAGVGSDVEALIEAPSADPVTSAVILADLQLSYGLLALTSHGKVIPMELSDASLPLLETADVATPAKSAYHSLLGPRSFDVGSHHFDAAVNKASAKSIIPRDQLRKPLEQITAENLRLFGQVVDKISDGAAELERLSNKTEDRVDLQVQEVTRQLAKMRAVMRKLNEGGDAMSDLQQRYEKVISTQADLSSRLDKSAQTLMNQSQPQLSQYEQSWFAEIARTQELLEGTGQARAKSLLGRFSVARDQFDMLKPTLESIREAEEARSRVPRSSPFRSSVGPGSPGQLGFSQVKRVERALTDEARSISTVVNELTSLQEQLSSLSVDQL